MSDDYLSVETTVCCLRFHPSGEGYGSPYTFSCLVTCIGDTGWISMATTSEGRFTPSLYRAIRKRLIAMGLKAVRFERKTVLGERTKEIQR